MINCNNHIAKINKQVATPLLLIIFLILFQSTISYSQQRPQFTQYISNELIINPAFAGAEGPLSAALVFRNQWSGIEGSPTTQTFTAHSLIKSKNLGIGLSVINDKIGIHKSLLGDASFSYRIPTGETSYFSFGLQFGFNQRRSDFNSISNQVQSASDPVLFGADLTQTQFEFGSGVYFRSKKLSLGFSIPNMLPAKTISDTLDFSISNANMFLSARYKIPVSKNFILQPGLLLKRLEGTPLSYDINLALIFNEVVLVGVSYRKLQSVNTAVQFRVTPQLRIGYAYDIPISNENTFNRSSHEFMISYFFSFSKHNVTKPRE